MRVARCPPWPREVCSVGAGRHAARSTAGAPRWRPLVLASVLAATSGAWGCAHAGRPTLADTQLAFAVRTALVNDVDVGIAAVDVAVDAGVVTLGGRVASDAERRRVVEIAAGVPGVRRVDDRLAVGTRPADAPPEAEPGQLSALATDDFDRPPQHFAVGAVFTVPFNQSTALDGLWTAFPVFRVGRGSGWRPAVSLTWVRAGLPPTADADSFGELRLLTLGGGLGYGLAVGRWSVSAGASLGWSFNHVRLEPGPAVPSDEVLPVAASNSPALTVSTTLWFEATRRVSLGVTGAYLWTRPKATWIDGDRFVEETLDADAVLLGLSVAWWLF